MVIFNELRITEDATCLVVDCEIENVDVYANMYIQSIKLEYYKNFSVVSMPSEKAYVLYEKGENETAKRGKRITMKDTKLPETLFDIDTFEDGLFYVVVTCGGDPLPQVAYMPCTYDDNVKVGVVLDWASVYKRGMRYVASIYGVCGNPNFCEDPNGFEDFIILWNSLKLAIETCNWPLVSELWDKFLNAPYSLTPAITTITGRSSGCGCGR